jgi:hypothetical protein
MQSDMLSSGAPEVGFQEAEEAGRIRAAQVNWGKLMCASGAGRCDGVLVSRKILDVGRRVMWSGSDEQVRLGEGAGGAEGQAGAGWRTHVTCNSTLKSYKRPAH